MGIFCAEGMRSIRLQAISSRIPIWVSKEIMSRASEGLESTWIQVDDIPNEEVSRLRLSSQGLKDHYLMGVVSDLRTLGFLVDTEATNSDGSGIYRLLVDWWGMPAHSYANGSEYQSSSSVSRDSGSGFSLGAAVIAGSYFNGD